MMYPLGTTVTICSVYVVMILHIITVKYTQISHPNAASYILSLYHLYESQFVVTGLIPILEKSFSLQKNVSASKGNQ